MDISLIFSPLILTVLILISNKTLKVFNLKCFLFPNILALVEMRYCFSVIIPFLVATEVQTKLPAPCRTPTKICCSLYLVVLAVE